jgi:hypothetical protein
MAFKKDRLLLVFALLFLMGFLLACGKSSGASSACRAEIGQSCFQVISGGRSEVSLAGVKAGEEFILTVQSLEETPSEGSIFPLRFEIASDPSEVLRPEEQEARRRLKQELFSKPEDPESSELPEAIDAAREVSSENIEDEMGERSFFVPNFSQFENRTGGEPNLFFLREATDPNQPALQSRFLRAVQVPRIFNLYFEPTQVAGPILLERSKDCLEKVITEMRAVIGGPLDLDNNPAIDILIASLPGGGGQTIGRFNYLDRFAINNGRPIPENNPRKEILYLSSQLLNSPGRDGPSRVCSTSAHELQHLINFDWKVLSQIPQNDRADLGSMQRYRLRKERPGLDEGLSHLVEELSGEDQKVYLRAISFLQYQSSGTFALEISRRPIGSNSKTRGANLALLYFALKKKNAQLRWNDPVTQQLLREWISSREVGYEKIGESLQLTKEELFAEFWSALDAALYDPQYAQEFLPAPESTSTGLTRGIRILSRDESFEAWMDRNPNEFHPLLAELPILGRSQRVQLYPESFSRFKFVAPSTPPSRPKNKIVVEGRDRPYLIVWSRVR